MELRICLLGFGEVGQILGTDLTTRGFELCTWDLKFADPASAPSTALARHRGVRAGSSLHGAVHGANLILSAVTADQALAAARSAATSLGAHSWFVDLNSVSPGVKQEAARAVEAAGGRYIEGAVMSAFPPRRLAVPMNLGGPHAGDFLAVAQHLGFTNATVFSERIGPASAAKMSRSIIIKGMEALVLESMLTARHYGVEQSVLESLADLLPASDWRALSQYMISRALQHGRRRAEEMHEACATVAAADLTPLLSTAIARRQAWAGEQQVAHDQPSLEQLLDSIRQRIATTQVRP